ncbi:MAG: hypothetical protein ACKOYJ_09290 [Planctomycetia bacterium]
MKIAAPSISKDSIVAGLLAHGEKIVVGIVLLLALWLVWIGISSIRSDVAAEAMKPDKIVSQSQEALTHIDKEPNPPKDKLIQSSDLPGTFAAWKSPGDQNPRKPILSRPLFEDRARRTRPDVFAVEDLQAVSGIAVLAKPVDPANPGGRDQKPRFRPAQPADPLGGIGPNPADKLDPAERVPPGTIVPYVVVTGLIPHAKQTDEYTERFQSASFRDPNRDAPLWSDFLVERADVTNNPTEKKWERINLKTAAKSMQTEWAGTQPDVLPSEFFLSPTEQSGLADATYAWPMPQLAMEPWGAEAIHPWAAAEWKRRLEETQASQVAPPGMPGIPGGSQMGIGPGRPTEGGAVPPGFDDPTRTGAGIDPPEQSDAEKARRLEYRVFRFVDTGVTSGRQYQYRVRLSVWNPNLRVPAQHLAEPDLATAMKLPSPSSNETKTVAIPDLTSFLARLTPKELKRDTAEVLVMWPNDKTGNYALHSVVLGTGGMISVRRPMDNEGGDRKPTKPGKKKEPQAESIPVGVLIDFVGKQNQPPQATGDQPAVRRGGKRAPPQEPFEVLVVAEDGSMARATVVDSEEQFMRYATTLPADLLGEPAGGAGPNRPQPGLPGF